MLTKEQLAAVDAAKRHQVVKIVAGAGTGKTTTLKAIAESKPNKRGLYLAFNRAMAEEARRKMPPTVTVKTAHALAAANISRRFFTKVEQRLPGSRVARELNLEGMRIDGQYFSPSSIGYALIETVKNFCNSADNEITTAHVPRLAGEGVDLRIVNDWLVTQAKRLWALMADADNDFPSTHDVYLKLWVMKGPRLNFDYIMFDEAQDANPLMLHLVEMQNHTQRIFVGDPNQQIYEWRGAVNAMDSIAADAECTLTESFRFSPEIASFANFALALCESPMRLVGRGPNRSTPEQVAFIFRTNGGMIEKLLKTDLSATYIVGGTEQLIRLLEALQELYETGKTFHRELAAFESWEDLIEHCETAHDDLATLVNATDRGARIPELIYALGKTCKSQDRAKQVFATAHKSKGLEWAHVVLGDDFPSPSDAERWTDEEARLIYVAGTRATKGLRVKCAADLGCKPRYGESTPAMLRPKLKILEPGLLDEDF